MKTKRIIRAAAALLAALLCALALAGCGSSAGGAGDTGYVGEFNYLYSDLSRYVHYPKSVYTGQTVDISKEYSEPAPYTMEYIEENYETIIKELRFSNRTGDAASYAKSVPIATGDDVYFYILEAAVTGGDDTLNAIARSILCNAYASSPNGPFTMGYDTLLGEDFESKIIGMVPKTTSLVKDTMALLTEGDVVCMSYSWKPASGAAESGSYARVVLSDLKEGIRNALFEAFNEARPYGEALEFKATDGGVEYTCTAAVFYVAKETAKDVTFTVPSDFFSEDAGDNSEKLNGKEITVKLIVPYTVDYEVPEADVAFFKETLGVETDKTDLDSVIAAFKQKSLDELNAEAAAQPKSVKSEALWNYLVQVLAQNQSMYITTLPDSEMNAEYSRAYQTRYAEYANYYSGYFSSVDEYMYAAYGYQSLAEYAQSAAMGGVARAMLKYWIYRVEGLALPKEEEDKLYTEYVDGLIAAAEENRTDRDHAEYNAEYFEDRYGAEALRLAALETRIDEIVTDYLLEQNTVIIGAPTGTGK